jgi:tartronate-semialdehyde synthase
VQVLANNSYLGLIRQSQRSVEMDFCVQLDFEKQNIPEKEGDLRGYGVDPCKVVASLGCKALRMTESDQHLDRHRNRQRKRVRAD